MKCILERNCFARAICLVASFAALPLAVARAQAQEYGAAAAPTALVVFQPVHADVSVTGWDADSVHVTAERTGSIRLDIEPAAHGVQVLERRALADASVRPTYRLFVPRGATVRVTAQEGSITLRELRGAVRAGIVDGSLRADSLSGSVELSTVTGALEAAGSDGRIQARSVAGDVTLSGVSGSIRARSISGDVQIALAEPGIVEAESYSGRITFAGALSGEASSFATHSGDIELRLPGSGNVTLFLTSVQGQPVIVCDEQRSPASGDAAEPLPVGAGGAPVEIVTFSGAVEVRCGEPRG